MAKLSRRLEVIIDYAANLSGIDAAIKRQELFQKSYEGLNKDLFQGSKILNQTTKTIERQGKVIAQVTTEYKKGKGPIQTLTREFEVQAVQVRKNGKFTGEWAAVLKALDTGLKTTSTTATRSLGVFANLGGEFKKIITRAFLTVPAWQAVRDGLDLIGGGVRQTIKNIDDLDEGIRRTITVFDKMDRTTEVAEKLRKTFYDLSVSSGASIEDIAKSSRELARAGLDSEQTIKATAAATKLMTVAETSQETTTRALVLANNLFGDSIKEAANGQNEFSVAAAFFSKVADRTVGSMEELFQSFVVFAPTARELGLSLEQTTGLIATLGNIGFTGTSGGTILNRLFSRSNADIQGINEIIRTFGGTVDKTATPFERLVNLFKTLNATKASKESVFAAFVDFFGEKGQKGIAFLDELPKFLSDLSDMEGILSDASGAVVELDEKFRTIAESNKLLKAQIQTTFGGVGEEILILVTGTNDFNSALKAVKQTLTEIKDGFDALNDNITGNIFFKGIKEILKFDQQFSLARKAYDKFIEEGKKKRKVLDGQEDSRNLAVKSFSAHLVPTKEEKAEIKKQEEAQQKTLDAQFIFNRESKKNLIRLKAEYKALLENNGVINKSVNAQKKYENSLDTTIEKLKEVTGKDVSRDTLDNLIGSSPKKIGEFLKSLGLEGDTKRDVTKLIEKNTINKITALRQEQKEKVADIARTKELQELDINRLRLLGFSESELSALKLELYKNEVDFKDRAHKQQMNQLEEQQAKLEEIVNSIKSSFQSNFESLFKNEITPRTFASNIGDTFQNQSISSSARLATEAVLGTGLAAQFASAIDATEQNPIVRSFIDGARKAGTIIEQSMVNGAAKAQTGINTGDVTGQAGLLGGLLPNFNKKGVFANAPNLTQSGLLNAGITGALTGLASSQRGGAAGILGGGGGFLTSLVGSGALKGATGLLGAIAPALGPIGAALTIASFFTKSKKTETRTEEQLISIAPKIDVSNKKLELINRNLVALKNVMEIYVLPQSSYFSESRNISDTFSIYARRGLA